MVGSFEFGDVLALVQGHPDFIQAADQVILHCLVDVKMEADLLVEVEHDALFLQVDGGLQARKTLHHLEDVVDLGLLELHVEQAVLHAIVVEDVGEGRDAFLFWRQDRLQSVLGQRPDGVLPRGAAAEVIAGDQYGGAAELRAIHLEIRVWLTVRQVSPVKK